VALVVGFKLHFLVFGPYVPGGFLPPARARYYLFSGVNPHSPQRRMFFSQIDILFAIITEIDFRNRMFSIFFTSSLDRGVKQTPGQRTGNLIVP